MCIKTSINPLLHRSNRCFLCSLKETVSTKGILMKQHPPITRKAMAALEATGHVVYLYPRKKLVVVDGSKYYCLQD